MQNSAAGTIRSTKRNRADKINTEEMKIKGVHRALDQPDLAGFGPRFESRLPPNFDKCSSLYYDIWSYQSVFVMNYYTFIYLTIIVLLKFGKLDLPDLECCISDQIKLPFDLFVAIVGPPPRSTLTTLSCASDVPPRTNFLEPSLANLIHNDCNSDCVSNILVCVI